MLTKEKVIDSMRDFPGEFSIDELVDRLVFIQKIEEGVVQGERGEVMTTEELKRKLSRWSV
jgi:predicted transcriptional regulator